MKLSIEIEDITDKKACVLAAGKLFTAFIDHHGYEEAFRLMMEKRDLNTERARAYWSPRNELGRALSAEQPLMEEDDKRLVLEYFAMKKPSKQGLAKELARKNVLLNKQNKEWIRIYQECWEQYRPPPWPKQPPPPYGSSGSTSADTILQQIKRVFRDRPAACAAIGAAPADVREEELRKAEVSCRMAAMNQALGLRTARYLRRAARRGTK
jgi:hypothetical protein